MRRPFEGVSHILDIIKLVILEGLQSMNKWSGIQTFVLTVTYNGCQFDVGDGKIHDYEDDRPEKIELGFQFENTVLTQHPPQHTFQNEIQHLHFLPILDAIVLKQLQVFLVHKNVFQILI
jgi:hypothetical protein